MQPRGKGRAGRTRPPRERSTAQGSPRTGARSGSETLAGGRFWLYGRHAVAAALGNPRRQLERLRLGEAPDAALAALIAGHPGLSVEVGARESLAAALPADALHQGIALLAWPLEQPSLAEVLEALPEGPAVVLALDHVTDPHNVGAILRSAAAFGAAAVLTTSDHAPAETAALARAASGGLEVVPYLRETNLVRSLLRLKEAGFWCYGLDEAGTAPLARAEPAARSCIVLGAEGEGLRRLTRESCDLLLRLPTRPPITALNVSNAAAIALYELLGRC